MAYSKNAHALNLFCVVSKNQEHFVTNFKNQCNFYKKQVHDFYVLGDCISRLFLSTVSNKNVCITHLNLTWWKMCARSHFSATIVPYNVLHMTIGANPGLVLVCSIYWSTHSIFFQDISSSYLLLWKVKCCYSLGCCAPWYENSI